MGTGVRNCAAMGCDSEKERHVPFLTKKRKNWDISRHRGCCATLNIQKCCILGRGEVVSEPANGERTVGAFKPDSIA
jgi:hypothetical protein